MAPDLKSRFPNIDRFFQYAMVLSVIVLISFLYPNNVKFKYEFQKGQTWRYDNLEAPFDFAIKKSETEIADDREKLIQNFSPYYRLNPDLAGAKLKDSEAGIASWAEAARLASDSLPGSAIDSWRYIRFSNNVLNEIYNQGIIQLAKEHQEKEGNFVINVVTGNTTYKRTLSSYQTLEKAMTRLREAMDKNALEFPPDVRQLLINAIAPNLTYDEALTGKLLQEALAGLVTTKGLVQQGESIAAKGSLITDDVYEKLVSFRETYTTNITSRQSYWAVYAGYFLITTLIMVALMMYLNAYLRDILLNWKHLSFILMWVVLFSYLTFLLERVAAINAYIVPFCIVPVIVSHFFSFRLAFFTHVIVVLIAGFLTSQGFPFLFMQIVAGVAAVLTVADARDWSKFFISVLVIILAYALAYLAVSIIEEGSLTDIDWQVFALILFNGLLTLLAFPLIPLVEKIFGFTSSISLVELSDMNRPLLRELTIKAPGTLQHSLQVGNLSEAAASEVGADALLLRVAALYHDIGKMLRPEYFVENQGAASLHENISPEESAKIIIEHVTQGVELARKNRLPKLITRFIQTHHGTTRVEYFYKTHLKNNPGETVDERLFTYPGPRPVTKEEGILMLADTVEAAARSLKTPSGEELDELVERLVAGKIKSGQLNECDLTFGDVATCKEIFKKVLRSVYHVRIEYPE